jgi:hypothetical protein
MLVAVDGDRADDEIEQVDGLIQVAHVRDELVADRNERRAGLARTLEFHVLEYLGDHGDAILTRSATGVSVPAPVPQRALEIHAGSLTLGELAGQLGITVFELLEELAPLLLGSCAKPAAPAESSRGDVRRTEEVVHAAPPVESPARPGESPGKPVAPVTAARVTTIAARDSAATRAQPNLEVTAAPFFRTAPPRPSPLRASLQGHEVADEPARPGRRETAAPPHVVGKRSKVIAVKRIQKGELAVGLLVYPERVERPRTRGECRDGIRPCPYVSCKYNLYLDVDPKTGSIKLNFPELQPWQMAESCALDVAERGGVTLEETADLLNITRERVRQVQERALAGVYELDGDELRDLLPHEDQWRLVVRDVGP